MLLLDMPPTLDYSKYKMSSQKLDLLMRLN